MLSLMSAYLPSYVIRAQKNQFPRLEENRARLIVVNDCSQDGDSWYHRFDFWHR